MYYLLLEGYFGPLSLLLVHRDVVRLVGHFVIVKSSVIENIGLGGLCFVVYGWKGVWIDNTD